VPIDGIVVAPGAGSLPVVDVPDRIDIEQGDRMVLTWPGGAVTSIGAAELRVACPCAECREPSGATAIERLLAGDDPVRVTAARLVGSYAVNLTFAPDGHATGIFSFDLLRAAGE
jgi:ATP-binding protein involved in chromosome partitioning